MKIKLEDLPDEYRRQAERKIADEDRATRPSSHVEQDSTNALVSKKETPRFNRPVNISVHSKRVRTTDSKGVCSKYVIDSIVTAGVLEDDNPRCVKEVSESQEKAKTNETIIEIWEA